MDRAVIHERLVNPLEQANMLLYFSLGSSEVAIKSQIECLEVVVAMSHLW